MALKYCKYCGTDLTQKDNFCPNCGKPRGPPSTTTATPTTTQEVYVVPAEQQVYAQPAVAQPTVYEQPQFPQTVYEEARATGHPIYEQPQPAAQGQPTTQITQTFIAQQPSMQGVMRVDRKKPWLAALLGICVVGLGHLYLGEWLKGIGLMILTVVISPFTLFLAAPVFWVISCVWAYVDAKAYNRRAGYPE